LNTAAIAESMCTPCSMAVQLPVQQVLTPVEQENAG
jgi:hypothetical protein